MISPKLTFAAGGFILGLIAAGGIALWNHTAPAVEGKTAPAIANVAKETIPIKSVQVFTPPAKKKLDLPKDVQADPAAHVTGATTVTCDDRDKTVSSVLNEDGNTRMFVKAEPLPWFRQEEALGLTLDYGKKRDTDGSTLRAGVRLDLAQTKALHFGLTAAADGDSDWFYGVGIRFTIR